MMAVTRSDFSVECRVLSLASQCFHSLSIFEDLQVNEESIILGLGSNTLIINDKTRVKLDLNTSQSSIVWATLTFNLGNNESGMVNKPFISKRLVQIVINQKVFDDVVVGSEDLLFNLEYHSGRKLLYSTPDMERTNLTLSNHMSNESILPSKAKKVIIALFQSQGVLENFFVDKLLQNYFSQTRYLCEGDVFSVEVDETCMLDFNNINIETVYFKICEIQGHNPRKTEVNNITRGYFIDNSVTIYQVMNHQDFVPPRRIFPHYKPNCLSLFEDDQFVEYLLSSCQSLLPSCFNNIFNLCKNWMKPFYVKTKNAQGIELIPIFFISGRCGSGKSLLLYSLAQFFGVAYWRIDCITVGGAIPGQAEAKIKAVFDQLKSLAPCVLHLANIEALYQDADGKVDVRVMGCFEQQLKAFKLKWPIIIVATSQNGKNISPFMYRLFLDSATLDAPTFDQRKDIISWLVYCANQSIDSQNLQTVASQTSGFVFRDLQILVTLTLKEKYKKIKEESSELNTERTKMNLSDFSQIIGNMHKAFSESIGAPRVPSVSWKDVGGLESFKKEILRSLRSNMFNTGLKRSGLLLHGPPGTGKTLLAKAVATQCGRNFLSVKGPELLNMYVGQSEQNVRDLFELAKAASPCIIFFDELDSLAPNRGRSGDSGGVMDRVVSQLLSEMDDVGLSSDIFILGATNRPDLIDPALLRPGRLDKLLYVGPCEDRDSQLSVLTALTHKLALESDVDLKEVVSLLPASVSGAQLSALCSAAWMSAAKHSIQSDDLKKKTSVTVERDHFISALKDVF